MAKNQKSLLAILSLASAILLFSNIASAITINSVDTTTLAPGEEGTIKIEIENNLNDQAEDISLRLDFTDLPFISVGNSEFSVNELDEDEEEDFTFTIKAAQDIAPGDYQIPYVLEYTINGNSPTTREGSIGVTVEAEPELSYSVSTETPVQGRQGTITLRIVNKGFADAKFVNVKILPQGFTLLSEREVYVGTIDSDDFETATFDVIFDEIAPTLSATVEYRNFNNEQVTRNVNLPFDVYTEDDAIKAGIIQQSYTLYYIIAIVVIIILIIIWRSIRKRRRMKRSQERRE